MLDFIKVVGDGGIFLKCLFSFLISDEFLHYAYDDEKKKNMNRKLNFEIEKGTDSFALK